MSFTEHLEVLKRLHALINRKATGTSDELASKLGLSRASVYRYIKDLKSLGAEVSYCSSRKSYFYENSYYFKI